MKLQLALRLLLLKILQLYHLPSSLLLQSVTFLPVHWMPAPVCLLLYNCTFKVLYCKIKNVVFIFCSLFFFVYNS